MTNNKELATRNSNISVSKNLEISQPQQFVTVFKDANTGNANPYIKKAGMSWKLNEFANKHKGLKDVLIFSISKANEDGKELFEMIKQFPQDMQKEFMKQRDFEMEMFTSPRGEAVAKCILLFGDGLKVQEKANATKENVKMSTIHQFLDNMAATRAFNRAVRFVTADGFLNMDIVEDFNEFEYDENEISGDLDEIPFRMDDEDGNTEIDSMDSGIQKRESQFAEAEGGEPILPSAGKDEEDIRRVEKTEITPSQIAAIHAIMTDMGLTKEQMQEITMKKYRKTSSKDLTKSEASDLISYLKNEEKEFFSGTPFEEAN